MSYSEAEFVQYQDHMAYKKILLIPLQYESQNVLMVPNPQQQSADLFIIEFPRHSNAGPALARAEENRPTPMYMTDPFSQKNMTAFLPEDMFAQIVEFASTRDNI